MATPSTLVVETGAGLTNSNTYISRADADTYHADRLNSSTWENATLPNQAAALIMATRLLDERVKWHGYKQDEDQALEWPRYGAYDRNQYAIDSDEVPQKVKDATAELALFLLTSDRIAEEDTLGFKRIKAGSVEVEVDRVDRKPIIPKVVMQMVNFLGRPYQGMSKGLIRA